MKLFLLRHGLAVERGASGFKNDADRPLTPKGKRQLRDTCRALRSMKIHFDLILSSPLLRARQTAEIVAKQLKGKRRLHFSDALQPGGEPKRLIADLNRAGPSSEDVLLVGHEPDLSRLISLLVTGGPGLQMDFKKGGLCKLETEELRAGQCAILVWLLTPRQMKQIG